MKKPDKIIGDQQSLLETSLEKGRKLLKSKVFQIGLLGALSIPTTQLLPSCAPSTPENDTDKTELKTNVLKTEKVSTKIKSETLSHVVGAPDLGGFKIHWIMKLKQKLDNDEIKHLLKNARENILPSNSLNIAFFQDNNSAQIIEFTGENAKIFAEAANSGYAFTNTISADHSKKEIYFLTDPKLTKLLIDRLQRISNCNVSTKQEGDKTLVTFKLE